MNQLITKFENNNFKEGIRLKIIILVRYLAKDKKGKECSNLNQCHDRISELSGIGMKLYMIFAQTNKFKREYFDYCIWRYEYG